VKIIVNRLSVKKEYREDSYKEFATMLETLGIDAVTDKRRIETHIASKPVFNVTIAVLIIVSVIIVGVELDMNIGYKLEERLGFFLADVLFTLIFFIEMLLRQNQLGWDFFLDPWNFFDYALIVVNCADVVADVLNSVGGGAKVATGMRIIRLMRVARHTKGLRPLLGMYMVVQGMVESLKTMVWTGLFLVIMTYVFAISLMTVVDTPVVWERMTESQLYMGSVYNSMMTIIQVFTLDDWASDIARPLLFDAHNTPAVIVLILAIIVCNYGILNLIIALMVERMSVMRKDIEAGNGKILSRIEQGVLTSLGNDFRRYDSDRNSELDHKEFMNLIRQPETSFKLRLLGFRLEEAESFFHIMDADHSNSISPEEFIQGLNRVRGLARGADICSLISFVQRQSLRARDNVHIIRNLSRQADKIQERLNEIGKRLHDEIHERNDRKQRSDDLWDQAQARTGVITNLDKDRRVQFPSVRHSY